MPHADIFPTPPRPPFFPGALSTLRPPPFLRFVSAILGLIQSVLLRRLAPHAHNAAARMPAYTLVKAASLQRHRAQTSPVISCDVLEGPPLCSLSARLHVILLAALSSCRTRTGPRPLLSRFIMIFDEPLSARVPWGRHQRR